MNLIEGPMLRDLSRHRTCQRLDLARPASRLSISFAGCCALWEQPGPECAAHCCPGRSPWAVATPSSPPTPRTSRSGGQLKTQTIPPLEKCSRFCSDASKGISAEFSLLSPALLPCSVLGRTVRTVPGVDVLMGRSSPEDIGVTEA